jgi:hypothetical protein
VSRSLSAIAERKSPGGGASEELEDYAEEGVDEDGDGEGSGSEEEGVNVKVGKELQRGMEGERMLKSGYLFKKQEKRKVSGGPGRGLDSIRRRRLSPLA